MGFLVFIQKESSYDVLLLYVPGQTMQNIEPGQAKLLTKLLQ